MVSDPRPPSPTDRDDRRLIAVAVLALIVKLALAAVIPLSADEAYYWVWTRHLDFGYYDHPPMVAWLLALGRPFESFGYAVRFPAVILGHATIFVWLSMLKSFLPEKGRLAWLALFLACPLTGLGGIVVTPDLPLLFFWSLSIFFIYRLIDSSSGWLFLGLGAALGLGFCSKYQIVLLPLSLLALIFHAPTRKALLRPGLFLTFLTGLLACAPVLGWNAQREWESFLFQWKHGLEAASFSWTWPVEYAVGQFVLVFPPIVFAAWRARKKTPRGKILAATAIVPFAFFFMTSFRAPVELNWPIMAFPSVFALAAATVGSRGLWITTGFWGAVQALLVVSVFLDFGVRLHEKLAEPVRFKSVAELPMTHAPLFASTYQMASSLWSASGVPVYKLRGMSRVDMYDRWPGSIPPSGTFFLLREEGQSLPAGSESWSLRVLTSPAPGLELLEVRAP